jgi:S-adenosylmethionine hydrolase
VVTNIQAAWLTDVRPGQRLQVTVADDAHLIPFCLAYAEASPGTLVCLVNSDAAFEVAVSQGNASERLRVQVGDAVLLHHTTAP